MIINYRTVISLGQKNVDEMIEKFEHLLVGPMEDVIKKANLAGVYYGLGQSGRTLYISVAFSACIFILVYHFGIDNQKVFFTCFYFYFTFGAIGQ